MRQGLFVQILTCNKRFLRYYSDKVRVRFAPSPTGYLHLGGLRTGLYNYLFAKSHGGKFILRIEDTDQTRVVSGAAEQLKHDLTWAGIKIDEGPGIGGNFGPYTQSERLQIYKDNIKTLLENGSAYYCFCTDKRLDLLRREALRARQVPKYDNKCRHLSKEEINKRLSRDEKYCIRFRLLPDCETFEDLIYGNIAYDVARNEGDPIIIKTDGFPTYHFANVVDDHYMKVTHVLRGVEWQISTTKHILMYRAFNWAPPIYGHLPLLINSDGTKLSKRQGDIKISHYRNSGIYPLALLNFLTSCGGGFLKDMGGATKLKIFTMEQLTDQFNVEHINVNPGKLESARLNEFNRLEMERLLKTDDGEKKLVNELQSLIKEYFVGVELLSLQMDYNYLKTILCWSINRITKLKDLLSKDYTFLWVKPNLNDCPTSEQLSNANDVLDLLKNDKVALKKDLINAELKCLCEAKQIKYNNLMKLLRKILSGLKEGPSVAEMMEILGKDATLNRLETFIHNPKPK